MAYYGFEHRQGANMRDDDGNLIGTLVIFRSRAKRDIWVGQGSPYVSVKGQRTRTALKSLAAAKFRRACDAVEYGD